MGDSRAIIWHDGRGNKDRKLVIKDSYFDAKSPTLLGRYHHDSQFFLLNCRLSKQILDTNISYAYSDKVLDRLQSSMPLPPNGPSKVNGTPNNGFEISGQSWLISKVTALSPNRPCRRTCGR